MTTSDLLAYADIDPITVPAARLELHVAEKQHAYSRRYQGSRPSTRVKDLVDLALIAEFFPLDAASLRDTITHHLRQPHRTGTADNAPLSTRGMGCSVPPARTSRRDQARTRRRLHCRRNSTARVNQTQLPLAKQRLDQAHDRAVAADRDPLADLERPLASEMPGRDDLLAAAQLVAVVRHRPARLPR